MFGSQVAGRQQYPQGELSFDVLYLGLLGG